MTDTLLPSVTEIPQERRLVTELPGPRSRALMERRTAAVSAGVGGTMPVFVERAGGGVIVDVDGNSLIDLGSGIAVTTVGNSHPRVVERVQQRLRAAAGEEADVAFMPESYMMPEELGELSRIFSADGTPPHLPLRPCPPPAARHLRQAHTRRRSRAY